MHQKGVSTYHVPIDSFGAALTLIQALRVIGVLHTSFIRCIHIQLFISNFDISSI